MTSDRSALNLPALAVIPLRAGSKGLVGKNTAILAGKPLYMHAVEQAENGGVPSILITTDIIEVHEADYSADVVLHSRPPELAGDEVPMSKVLVDALARAEYQRVLVVLLQATSPLREPSDIRAAVSLFRSCDADMVMSVSPADPSVLKHGTLVNDRFQPLRKPRDVFSNRQDLPSVVRPNGAVYVFESSWFLERGGDLVSDNIAVSMMSLENSIDIDSAADLERCAFVFERRDRLGQ